MRLQVKMLAPGAQLNNYRAVDQVTIQRGENPYLYFQLFDDETGNRYIPAAGSTLEVQIPRFLELVPTFTGQACPTDYSVDEMAAQPFPCGSVCGDASIWYLPLTSAQTNNMTSSNIRFTLNEPIPSTNPQAYNTSIATTRYAIKVYGDLQ